jgi:hypothetical protein
MTVSLSKRLLGIVDKTRKVNRAQFIRDALAEKLASMGIPVPGSVLEVPDRVKVRHDVHRLNVTLNDEPSADPIPPRQDGRVHPKPPRKPRKPKA